MRTALFAVGFLGFVFIATYAYFTVQFLVPFTPPWQGVEEMNNEFIENREALVLVRDYLAELEFESVLIGSDHINDGVISIRGEHIAIESEDVLGALTYLFDRGFQVIIRRSDIIRFQKWSTLDHGRGIAYSIDGRIPDENGIQHLTEIESLSEEGWYFYIADFNVWRTRIQRGTSEGV